jgi:hypothetical protein
VLIKAKAPPITSTTTAPATKLPTKLDNEGDTTKATTNEDKDVIFDFLLFQIIKLKIVNLTTITIVSTFRKKV